MAYLIYGGAAFLGILFILFGLIIKLFPVPVSVLDPLYFFSIS